MKKILVNAAAVLAVVGLAGCSGNVSTTENETGLTVSNDCGESAVSVVQVPTDTGSVTCAVLVGFKKGGLSCDWNNAK